MLTDPATTPVAGEDVRVRPSEVAGATRAMFFASASAMPMMRGPSIAYAPEDDGAGGGGGQGGVDGADQDDQDLDDGAGQGAGDDESDDEIEGDEGQEDLEDVEFEGKTYKLPKEVRRGLLREADYTKKTQDLAERGRALDAERAQHAERTQAVRTELGRVAAAEDLVKKYEAINDATWQELRASDPDTYRDLRDEMREAKDKLEAAKGALTAKEAELTESERQADVTRLEEVEATLKRDIEGWGPERFRELVQFAGEQGISQAQLRQASAGEWKILNLAAIGAKSLKTKAAVKRHETTQSTRPSAPVRGSARSAGIGDSLGTDEWMRRRNAQTRPKQR